MSIILASKSPHRAQMLENTGISFSTHSAKIDERAVEAPLKQANLPPHDIAEVLAIAKAENVSNQYPSKLTIGCDQVLAFENELLHKVKNMEEARRRLLQLSGKTHYLHSAICLVKDGQVTWSHVETAKIKFRQLTPKFIGQHLAQTGDTILSSVGAYQIEGTGIQLFEKMEGDFFSIIGLPLLPLLHELRRQGALDG